MVSQATIQAKVNYGFGIAALKIAASYAVYRCQTTETPITPANLVIASQPVAIDSTPAFSYTVPAKLESDDFFAMLDLTSIQAGDYIVGQQGTFFLSQLEPFKVPAAIRCPRTISIERQDTPDVPGPQSRPSFSPSTGGWTQTVANVPASIQPDRERGRPPADLPGDVISRVLWKIRISPAFGLQTSANWDTLIREGDRIREDQTNNMFRVSQVLYQPSDWLIRAELLSASAG